MVRPVDCRRGLQPFLFGAVLFLSSLACSGNPFLAFPTPPSATSSPTYTATPTHTPTLTPTISHTPRASYLDWPVALSDSFDADDHGWPTGSKDWNRLTGAVTIAGGRLRLSLTAITPTFWWLYPTVRNLRDFYLSSEVRLIDGPVDADYGLVFRDARNSYYYFSINTFYQNYHVAVYSYDEWTDLIYWTKSPHILPDGPNQIAVKAEGSKFIFIINGEEVDFVEDDTLKMGKVGVGLSLFHSSDTIELEFDNFEVRVPVG